MAKAAVGGGASISTGKSLEVRSKIESRVPSQTEAGKNRDLLGRHTNLEKNVLGKKQGSEAGDPIIPKGARTVERGRVAFIVDGQGQVTAAGYKQEGLNKASMKETKASTDNGKRTIEPTSVTKSNGETVSAGDSKGKEVVLKGRKVEAIGETKEPKALAQSGTEKGQDTAKKGVEVSRGRVIEGEVVQKPTTSQGDSKGKDLVPVNEAKQSKQEQPKGGDSSQGSNKNTAGDQSKQSTDQNRNQQKDSKDTNDSSDKNRTGEKFSPETEKWLNNFSDDLRKHITSGKPEGVEFMRETLKNEPIENQKAFFQFTKEALEGRDVSRWNTAAMAGERDKVISVADKLGTALAKEAEAQKMGQGDPRYSKLFNDTKTQPDADATKGKEIAHKGKSEVDLLKILQELAEKKKGDGKEVDWVKFWTDIFKALNDVTTGTAKEINR